MRASIRSERRLFCFSNDDIERACKGHAVRVPDNRLGELLVVLLKDRHALTSSAMGYRPRMMEEWHDRHDVKGPAVHDGLTTWH